MRLYSRTTLRARVSALALTLAATAQAAQPASLDEIRGVDAETLARIEARLGASPPPAPAPGPVAYLGLGALAAAIGIAASGGGGDGDVTDPPAAPPPDRDAAPFANPYTDRRPTTAWRDALGPDPRSFGTPESFNTSEFQRGWSLETIGVRPRYADGGTGWDTLVSVIDSGADVSHPELDEAIVDDLSYSYYTGASSSADVTDTDSHGTGVASIIAGAKDGEGLHGVAFDARLQILKAIAPGSAGDVDFGWAIADANLRAAEAGAIVVNNSWETAGTSIADALDSGTVAGAYSPAGIEALRAAAKKGIVSVYAAGNSANREVSVNAGLPLAVSGLEDHWLAVVATDSQDRIADFSNRCGAAVDFCLAAPGVELTVARSADAEGLGPYQVTSGTSFAAPHVSGAVAVLKSAFPELTGAQIADILLATARDAGDPGPDPVYGQGILDLSNAVAPQGPMGFKTGSDIHGGEIAARASGVVAGGALGASLAEAVGGRRVMLADTYDRGYSADLGGFVVAEDGDALTANADAALRDFALHTAPVAIHATDRHRLALSATATTRGIDAESAARAAHWVDPDALSAPYAGLIEARRLSFDQDAGAGRLRLTSAASDPDSAAEGRYAAAAYALRAGPAGLVAEMGLLEERGAMLGARGYGAFATDMRTRTRFARLAGTVALGAATRVHVAASTGTSEMRSRGLLRDGAIDTTSLAAGVSRTGLLSDRDTLTMGVSRRLSVAGGRLDLDLPDAMVASDGGARSTGVVRRTDSVALAAAAAPVALQAGYTTPAWGGNARLGAHWTPEETRLPAVGAGLSWAF